MSGASAGIVVLGAGALGSVVAAHLARAGEDVHVVARGRRARSIREHGLTIAGRSNFTVPVRVTDEPRTLKAADVLLVTVKTYDMEEALDSVEHLDVGCALSVQNGVYKNEQLARRFGWNRTLGATAGFGGEMRSDGVAYFSVNEGLFTGELPSGTSARVDGLASTLERAGIRAVASPAIRTVEWSKYVVFVSLTAAAVLTRLDTITMLKNPSIARVVAGLQQEMAQLARKLDIPLEDYGWLRARTVSSLSMDEAVASIQQSGEQLEAMGAAGHKVSTLQDLERGRRLEVDETLGYAVRKGAELGVPLPMVETCYRLVAGISRETV